MNTDLMTIIGGIVILIMIIIAIVIRMKNQPSSFDKEAANNFLEGLSNVFYKKMMEIINNIDFSLYNSLEELETSVLSDIYATIWSYVETELSKAVENDILTAMVLKVLNKDFIDKFIDKIINNASISEKVENAWNAHVIETTKETIEEECKKVEYKFSDEKAFYSECNKSDLPPAEENEVPEEELKKLNPQKDVEEVEYDPETDDSVEVIEDDITTDANGRKRSKSTGRYI